MSGQMHGYGSYHFKDGIKYEGEFVESTITGVGVRYQLLNRFMALHFASFPPAAVSNCSGSFWYIEYICLSININA